MPLRLLDSIAMAHSLHSVAVSVDDTQLYVPLGEENCISIVDLETGGIAGRIDLPGSPTDIAPSPNGITALAVGHQREAMGDRGKAYAIDLRTNRLTHSFSAGVNPQTVLFSPQGMFAYICEFTRESAIYPPGSLMVLRAEEWIRIAVLPTGDDTFSAACSPDGDFVYASTTFARGSLAIIDANKQEVTGHVTGMGGDPSGVAVSADGSQAYVAALSSARVNIVDTIHGVSTESIDVAPDPHALVVNPDRGELYVAHGFQLPALRGLVTVVDLDTHEVIQTLEFDGSGYRMALSHDGTRVYVADTAGQIVVFAVE